MLAALKLSTRGCTVERSPQACDASGAEHASDRALSSSTVCEILASSTAERAAKKVLPRLPARIRASALLPLVVGGAIEFCPDLAPRAATSAKSL